MGRGRSVVRAVVAVGVALLAAVGVAPRWIEPAAAANPRATLGEWSAVQSWPVYGVHMAVQPDGRVHVWDATDGGFAGTTGASMLWDPVTNGMESLSNDSTQGGELFCAIATRLPDGDLMAITGRVGENDPIVSTFSPTDRDWTARQSLRIGRYYPSATVTGAGRVVVSGGAWPDTSAPEIPEVYEDGAWRTLPGARTPFVGIRQFIDNASYYPWLVPAPDGRVFSAGPEDRLRYLDPSGSGTTVDAGPRGDGILRDYGSYAVYGVGKVLVAGGGPASSRTFTIDINGAAPVVDEVDGLATGRRQSNLTILANGEVLISGGNARADAYGTNSDSAPGSQFDAATAVYAGEIWNPDTEQWRTVAAMHRARQYHSSAILLPDGRVAASGGLCNLCTPERNVEIYSPPYLFDANGDPAPRPTITTAPDALAYGSTFSITSPEAASITKAHLIQLGSVTHSVNVDQRLVPLDFDAGPGRLDLAAPASANVARPGHYMLVVVDGNGVPSVAKILKVGGDPMPAPAPLGVPVGTTQRLRSENFPERAVRHQNFVADLVPVSGSSDALTLADSSLRVVPGLASASCVSLEATNWPGYHLRHRTGRVWLDPTANTTVYREQATWCPQPGLADPTGVSFRAYDDTQRFLRHTGYQMYADDYVNDSALYRADATFHFEPVSPADTPVASAAPCTAAERSSCSFTVRLSHASTQAITVGYATTMGTAGAADFTARSGTLDFAPGETTKVVTVPLTDDDVVEADETFSLAITSATNARLGGAGVATITDGTVTYTVRFPASDQPVLDASADFFALPRAELAQIGQRFLRFLTLLELQGGGSINPFTSEPPNEGDLVYTQSYTQTEDADIRAAANLWNVTPEGLHWAGVRLIQFLYLIS